MPLSVRSCLRGVLTVGCLAAAITLPPAQSSATEEATLPAYVRLVTGNDYPPFSGRDLPQGGMATELVRRVFDRAGLPATVAFEPWARGYLNVTRGDYLGTFPYIRTEDRDAEMIASDPIFVQKQLLVSAAERPIDFETEADLAGLTVCLPLGYGPIALVRSALEADVMGMVSSPDLATCMDLLQLGRADVLAVPDLVFRSVVRRTQYPMTAYHVVEVQGLDSKLHVMLDENNPISQTVIDRFNAALDALTSEGIFDELAAIHLTE